MNVIEMINITKEFPGIKANDNITLKLKKGEIHALLGENGAGKSTLMSILFGLYQKDSGTIKVRGEEVEIDSPNKANALGIGMVHQHFKLVHNFTVTENIILGNEPTLRGGRVDIKKATKKIIELSKKYNLNVDPDAKIEDISVGMQQRVEIIKMLYRDAEILIFDEPTAVLTPQEIDELIKIMKNLTKEGKSVILITHKLDEIKKAADRVTVIRKGTYVNTVKVDETSTQEMANMMVGREVLFTVEKQERKPKKIMLNVKNLATTNSKGVKKIDNVSFNVKQGEIVGLAGIEGNGQNELIEMITGLRKIDEGEVYLKRELLDTESIRYRFENGMGHIPMDRQKYGLVLDYTIEENMILQTYYQKPFSKFGLLNKKEIRKFSNDLIRTYDVRSGLGSLSIAKGLSGGNQQKAIIAREVSRDPDLLLAVQPTRGLDVGAIEFIHSELIRQRDNDKAILLVSLELDEILNLSDRILVIFNGKIVAELKTSETNEREIGLYMAGGHLNES